MDSFYFRGKQRIIDGVSVKLIDDKIVEKFELAVAGFLYQLSDSNKSFDYKQQSKNLVIANHQTIENELEILAKIIKAVTRCQPDMMVIIN